MTSKIDARWVDRLTEQRLSDEAEWMNRALHLSALERRRFFQNQVENPHFDYIAHRDGEVDSSAVSDLLDEIKAEESQELVREIYVRKLEHQLIRRDMYRATLAGDDAEFFTLSTQLYGRPKKQYFAYIARVVRIRCAEAETVAQRSAAERLLEVFSKIDDSACTISSDILPPIVEDDGQQITAGAVKKIFREVVKHYGIEGWDIEIDKTGTRRNFSVSGSKKKIFIPSNDRLVSRAVPFSVLQANAVAEHEIGVHVRRGYNGSQQTLGLLQYGLSGYLIGEEGLAAYVQQQVTGANEFYGIPRYMAAALAVGMDGTPRDFRGVYSLMYDYFTLTSKPDVTQARVRQVAWDLCIRVFRGTTGRTPGMVYTKDIVYLEGNVRIWNLLIERPHVFPDLFVGKYNPLDKAQVNMLKSLGIITHWDV